MEKEMTEEKAINIINKERINNSFTMGIKIDEFVSLFRARYLKMYGVILPNDYITIAKKIVKINANNDR